MIYRCLRPLLFRLDPESAHHITLKLLKLIYLPGWVNQLMLRFPQKPVELLGLRFPNPVGLAAGLDKNAAYIDALFGLGFGFIETGTVTPEPQPGNEKPRLFRIPAENALINRMGFNNLGVDCLVSRLQQRKIKGIVGVNIGKNRTTPIEKAVDDYRKSFEKVYPYADYVTINISSPNTPGLRELQKEDYLHDLLNQLKEQQKHLQDQHQRQVPLLLKISPDLTSDQRQEIVGIALRHRIEGLIASNTSCHRRGVAGLQYADEKGGLSGQPLFLTTRAVIEQVSHIVKKECPIIAVGGITSGQDAAALFDLGADLVQIYTGLIYKGPGLVREILSELIMEHSRAD